MFNEFARASHRALTETLTFTSLLKGVIKDTGAHTGEEIHGVGSGRLQGTGPSVSVELGHVPLLFQTPYYWDFMEASSRKYDQ